MNASYWDCSALLVMSPGSGIETEVPELIWIQSLYLAVRIKTLAPIKHTTKLESTCKYKIHAAELSFNKHTRRVINISSFCQCLYSICISM